MSKYRDIAFKPIGPLFQGDLEIQMAAADAAEEARRAAAERCIEILRGIMSDSEYGPDGHDALSDAIDEIKQEFGIK